MTAERVAIKKGLPLPATMQRAVQLMLTPVRMTQITLLIVRRSVISMVPAVPKQAVTT